MRYQIRYQQNRHELMTEIEAHSPDEAIVKFQHLKPGAPRDPDAPHVTSVSAADTDDVWA